MNKSPSISSLFLSSCCLGARTDDCVSADVRPGFRILNKIVVSCASASVSIFFSNRNYVCVEMARCSSHWPIIYLVKNDGIKCNEMKNDCTSHHSQCPQRPWSLNGDRCLCVLPACLRERMGVFVCVCVNKKNVYFCPIVFSCTHTGISFLRLQTVNIMIHRDKSMAIYLF